MIRPHIASGPFTQAQASDTLLVPQRKVVDFLGNRLGEIALSHKRSSFQHHHIVVRDRSQGKAHEYKWIDNQQRGPFMLKPKKNWVHAAGIAWPLLVEAGRQRTTLTYTNVAEVIHTNPLSVRYALDHIQNYCLENRLAPLTAVVVGRGSGTPGTGFIGWDVDDLEAAWDAVAAQNWALVGNPFAGFGPNDDEETLATQLVADPRNAAEVYRQVRDRGIAQRIFRSALLKAYEDKCALCGLSFTAALEAAHFVPWGHCAPEERLDVRNGILLCASHHRLFDCDVFAFREDMTIDYYDPEASDGEYGEADRSFALALHGATPTLPLKESLRPGAAYLLRRIKLKDEE